MRGESFSVTKGVRYKVHEEAYHIRLAGLDEEANEAFAEIIYGGERTLVVPVVGDEEARDGQEYGMISFLDELPLDLVGFLASVSNALAERDVPIFVISSYRTDHLLFQNKDLEGAIMALESLGMVRQ